jgi:hypothetical protein
MEKKTSADQKEVASKGNPHFLRNLALALAFGLTASLAHPFAGPLMALSVYISLDLMHQLKIRNDRSEPEQALENA